MNPTFGQRGDAVKAYQRKLNEQNQGKAGFTPLVVDGIFGAKTQAASNFQIPTTTPLPSSVSTKATFQDLASARPVVGDLNTQPVPPVDTTTPKSYAEIVLAQQQQQSTAQQNQDKTFEQILKDMTSLETKGADTAAALESSGFNTSRKVAQDLANQILANTAATQAEKLAIGGNVGGITTADRGGFESKIERERAIKNLNLTAQLQAAQGNMALAKETADAAINAKYAPIETRLANLKEFYTLNKDNLDREQKKNAELTNARLKDLEIKKADEKEVQKIVVEASQFAPKNILDRAATAKSPIEAAIILGQYSGDYLGNLVKKATLAKTNAEISKIRNDIKASNVTINTTNLPNTATGFTTKLLASSKNTKNLEATERQALSKAMTVVGQLDSLQQNIAKVNTGISSGRVASLMSKIGANKDAGVVQAQLQSIIPNLARGTYGEVGVLTDADIANYRQTVPNLTSSKDQNDAVLALTLKTVRNSMQNQLSSAANSGVDVSGWSQDYNRINKQITDIEDRIGVSKAGVNNIVATSPDLLPAVKEMYQQGLTDGEILEALNGR